MRRVLPPGCRFWKGSIQAYVRCPGGGRKAKSFPVDTPNRTLYDWQQRTKLTSAAPASGSFAGDTATYLARIAAHPSHAEIARHLAHWLTALGGARARQTVTAGEIDQVMQGWLRAGLAPDTARKRRPGLLAMFNRLDGKGGSNPVRESHPPPPTRPQVRTLDYAIIATLFGVMPPSRTRARLKVMAWTGLPPAQIRQLEPADVDLERGTVRVAPRRKGRGAEARMLPLLPQAVDAFREFAAVKAWGSFTSAPFALSFQRAAKRVGLTGARPYDLRHAYGALLYEACHDQATVGRLLLHASPAMTARYVSASAGTVDRMAVEAAGSLATAKVTSRPTSQSPESPESPTRPHRPEA